MARGPVVITAEGDNVIVTGAELLTDRSARLFFESIVAGVPIEAGWRCPRRRLSITTLILRINTFLERRGWSVRRVGLADQAVEREIERKRSFARTRDAAASLREGDAQVQFKQVRTVLAK